jgi:hypothetical protein
VKMEDGNGGCGSGSDLQWCCFGDKMAGKQ